jgi:ferritin-like protein
MGSGSIELHEDGLPSEVVDRHRAIRSMMEELEAVDWYDQRVAATTDASLAEVLAHNRDEEKEHFAMVLEWLRRHDAKIDEVLHTYLFTDGDILEIEHEAEQEDGGAGGADLTGNLHIGTLRDEGEGRL